jgi:hypothetical protein
MSESRWLDNTRIKAELGVRLRYPRVADGLGETREASLRAGAGETPA